MILHYFYTEKTDNGEKRCTKSVMRGCSDDAINLIKKATKGKVCTEFLEMAKMPNIIERVVACHEQDEYNPAEGMRIADEKLLQAYNKLRERAINRYVNACRDATAAIENVQLEPVKIQESKVNSSWYADKAAELLAKNNK